MRRRSACALHDGHFTLRHAERSSAAMGALLAPQFLSLTCEFTDTLPRPNVHRVVG